MNKTRKINEIFATLLNQLGGSKFFAMTGAQNISKITNLDNPALAFTVMKNCHNVRWVQITYDRHRDAYNIKTLDSKFRTLQATDCYADKLKLTFTELTGLDTHL
jgi:hypothetical protein